MTSGTATGGDEGFTLVEVLIALVILAVASVVLVASMGSLVVASANHRGIASSDAVLRDFSDAVKAKAATVSSSTYTTCYPPGLVPTGSASAWYTPPSSFTGTVTVTSLSYWIPADSTLTTSSKWGTQADCIAYVDSVCPQYQGVESTAPPALCDPGVEQVGIQVVDQTRTNHGTSKAIGQVVVRRP